MEDKELIAKINFEQLNKKHNEPIEIKINTKSQKDEFYTERYAVEPILEYLPQKHVTVSCIHCANALSYIKKPIIWCPFDTEDSEFVKVFREYGYKVELSHIDNGQDFFEYEPTEWDIMISNPPFSGKKNIFERALSFDKPFALIMDLTCLRDKNPAALFGDDLQILKFNQRMTFKNSEQKGINFACGYFCYKFLPKQILIRDLRK